MDIAGIGSSSSALSQAKTGDEVAITMLRKTMEIEAQSAAQLIAALPATTTSNPPNLGRGVDTFA